QPPPTDPGRPEGARDDRRGVRRDARGVRGVLGGLGRAPLLDELRAKAQCLEVRVELLERLVDRARALLLLALLLLEAALRIRDALEDLVDRSFSHRGR